jgi:hypothetical protein
MFTKKLQRSEDLFIQFTDEELAALNVKAGDKFSVEIQDDSVLLKKFASVEIDISEWPREVLEMLICDSIEKDISVNEAIVDILERMLGKWEVDGE